MPQAPNKIWEDKGLQNTPNFGHKTSFFFIKNYSPEVSNIERRGTELNIILPRVNNFDTKQKSAWSICFVIYLQYQRKP